MYIGDVETCRRALVLLVAALYIGVAQAAIPVALLKDLTWDMVREPMFNGHHGVEISLMFSNSEDATIVCAFNAQMYNPVPMNHDDLLLLSCSGSSYNYLVSLSSCGSQRVEIPTHRKKV